MIFFGRPATVFLLVCLFSGVMTAQTNGEIVAPKAYKPPVITESKELHTALVQTVEELISSYPKDKPLKGEEVAISLIDVTDPENLRTGFFRGDARIYPASVVKMFYMVALERQLEDGKATSTNELTRGLRDMIVDSSNEATQYIFDVITGTASGAEMPQKEFDAWQHKRNRVNRYFASMGYDNINVNQKTFCEDAYGIEQQSRNYKGENRNALTTNATARLLAEIVLGRVASPERTKHMMDLMKRDPYAKTNDADSQASAFTGKLLIDKKMTDTRLWSKAGWTSKTRHDAAYIEMPNGQKFVLVIFTENHANEKEIIPTIAGKIIERLSQKRAQ